MTGQGLSPARMDTASQLSHERVQSSPQRGRGEKSHGFDAHGRGNADVVDAEADVVDTLLTMRELASNKSVNDRVMQIATITTGQFTKGSAEDDKGTHRSDSAATGPTVGTAACISRDSVSNHRQTSIAGQGAGLVSRPNTGVAANILASRQNSFTGKKRKTGLNDEEPVNAASQPMPFHDNHDSREVGAAATAEATAAKLQHRLSSASGADALSWRQGVATGGGGSSASLPSNIGRVSSDPFINCGQRLPEAMLARLGLGAPTSMERLRGMVLGNGGADPAPSAKRPHVLSHQPPSAAAAHPLSVEDLQQHQQHLSAAIAAAAMAAAAAGERPSSDRQERLQVLRGGGGGSTAVKAGQAAEDSADVGACAAGGGASGESPGADHVNHGSGAAASAAMGTATGRTAGQGSRPVGPRCAPPSPLGHHSDTGSDSGSPSKRAPCSPASRPHVTHGSDQQPQQPLAGRGSGSGAAAACGAGPEGDDSMAPSGPNRTSSVISLLHTLAIHQEHQRQQQEQHQQQQQRYLVGQGHGRGPPSMRLSDIAELIGAVDVAIGGEQQRHGRGARERERSQVNDLLNDPRIVAVAAAMASGYPADAAAAARDGPMGPHSSGKAVGQQPRGGGGGGGAGGISSGGGGGGGSTVLLRQVSWSSRDNPHAGGAGPSSDPMQVDSSSSPPPLRTASGMAEAQAFLHPAAASRSAVAVSERSIMDCDVPLTSAAAGAAAAAAELPGSAGAGVPHNAAGAASAAACGDERIHASLAAIERKLLLQEERLMYELKQVRLMQKLLHVQQMKQMVREAMRGKDRDAVAPAAVAAAAAGVGGGPNGMLGTGSSPIPTTAAPTLGVNAEVVEGGLARLSSLPSHVLMAAARAMTAATGAGAASGAPIRDRSEIEVLRATSDAAAAAGAVALHGGPADHPNVPQCQKSVQPKQASQQPQRRSTQGAHPATAPDEEWSARGADGGGKLLSYIAALSGSKGTPSASTVQRRESGTANTTSAGALGAPDNGAAEGSLDGGAHGSWHRAYGAGGSDGTGTGANGTSTGGGAAYWNGASHAPQTGRAAYDDDVGGGYSGTTAGAVVGSGMCEEEQALLEGRIIQALLRQHHLQQQHIHDRMMPADDGAGDKS